MSKYIKSLVYILVLGLVTSALLIGADALTEQRIEQNKEALLKSTILDANQIDFNFQNIHDVFLEEIVIIEIGEYVFYEAIKTSHVSYQFEGSGLWGPIKGLITLDNSFVTIIEISILEHEETPGLGGVVSERDYLDLFVGKEFNPTILISKTADNSLINEVDSIAGATSTSNAFMYMLNNSYQDHKDKYQGGE